MRKDDVAKLEPGEALARVGRVDVALPNLELEQEVLRAREPVLERRGRRRVAGDGRVRVEALADQDDGPVEELDEAARDAERRLMGPGEEGGRASAVGQWPEGSGTEGSHLHRLPIARG